jgi:uncharacterized membrane protein YvbJ
MKRNTFRKLAIITASVSILLVAVLFVHIYLVTRPGKDQTAQRVMARIDFKQDINEQDADKITKWLYEQNGVDHVLCNASSNIAVFTFSPGANNADRIVAALKDATNYQGERYMPDATAMTAGCPVMADTWSGKLYGLFKKI